MVNWPDDIRDWAWVDNREVFLERGEGETFSISLRGNERWGLDVVRIDVMLPVCSLYQWRAAADACYKRLARLGIVPECNKFTGIPIDDAEVIHALEE